LLAYLDQVCTSLLSDILGVLWFSLVCVICVVSYYPSLHVPIFIAIWACFLLVAFCLHNAGCYHPLCLYARGSCIKSGSEHFRSAVVLLPKALGPLAYSMAICLLTLTSRIVWQLSSVSWRALFQCCHMSQAIKIKGLIISVVHLLLDFFNLYVFQNFFVLPATWLRSLLPACTATLVTLVLWLLWRHWPNSVVVEDLVATYASQQ